MKRFLALILIVVIVASVSCTRTKGETDEVGGITFQGMPWGSSVETVKEWIKNAKLLKELHVLERTGWTHVYPNQYLSKDEETVLWQSVPETAKGLLFIGSIHPDFKIAGYNLESVAFIFAASDETSKLIAVDVTIDCTNGAQATFADLQQKLRTVYGTGDKDNADTYFKLGANNTGVRLEYNVSFLAETCNLIYGYTNALDILEEMLVTRTVKHVDPTDVSGL